MNKFDIENLDLFYGDNQALKSINLPIPTRQVTALIGPSGCGKSTLLRCLNRMNDLIEGVTIKGKLDMDGTNIYGNICLLYTSPSPRDLDLSRMPSSA